jgi:serine phosphatase RsbU (regulator of sigma subunit)
MLEIIKPFMRTAYLVFFIAIIQLCGYSQTSRVLFQKLKVAQSDTQKISILNALTKAYIDTNLDSADLFNKQSLLIAQKNGNEKFSYKSVYDKALITKKRKQLDSALVIANRALAIAQKYSDVIKQANAKNLIGSIYEQLGKTDLAYTNFNNALTLSLDKHDKKEMASSYLHLGIYFKKRDKATEALFNLLKAMRLSEELKDSSVVFTTCINLGTMYERSKDYTKAMECYRKALFIVNADKEKDENDLAISYFKIGKLYQALKIEDSAKYYLTKTLQIHIKRNDEDGLIFDYSNLASFNAEVGDYVNAEKNYMIALDLALKRNDSTKLNMINSYLGMMYRDKKEIQKALKHYKTALTYVSNGLAKETVMMEYQKISEIQAELGNYKEALENYRNYKAWSDSSYNINETKKQTELKLNYEFEIVQKKREDETKAKEALNKIELEKERMQRNYLLFGFLIISVLLVVAIKSYRASRKANVILHKQKKEIEHQKKIVDEKNLEISDSINYALRIQTATIPKPVELTAYFKDHSILFKPKDIVSGDFYWAARSEEFSLVAIADCTGHGVPGAITSMIGSMLLNEIFYVKNILQPNLVLTELNRLVKLTLRQEEDAISNDGMDIAFCMFNNSTNELYYSGANRPIYIVNPNNDLIEYKATKVSIGGQVPLIQPYELHKIQLQTGDMVAISSDGYADQFGGSKEKKLSTKTFKYILSESSKLSPIELTAKLDTVHQEWKGSNEQTDDILVFVFKIS